MLSASKVVNDALLAEMIKESKAITKYHFVTSLCKIYCNGNLECRHCGNIKKRAC